MDILNSAPVDEYEEKHETRAYKEGYAFSSNPYVTINSNPYLVQSPSDLPSDYNDWKNGYTAAREANLKDEKRIAARVKK